MLRKIISAVILLPLLVVLVAFAVANRQPVTLSFDPFSSSEPAYALTLPLFIIVFTLLVVGVLLGGIAVWLGARHRRRAHRKLDSEVRQLHGEMDAMRRQFAPPDVAPSREPEPRPPLVLPPIA
jgi:uncharacterized integral membrane protein